MVVGHISCLHLQSDQKGDEGGIGNVSFPLARGSVVVGGHGHALIERGCAGVTHNDLFTLQGEKACCP